MMFRKILIANRGEIAVRIMATCREMGIQTVAVYSEADRDARHVYEADEAYEIGPAPAAQSYLKIDTIVATAQKSGAEAIHPGYGFLSENAAFAEACAEAGIVFIGPSAAAMRLMGSKIAAKQLAQEAEVPTVPGYDGASQSQATLLKEAERIGFPLLIKASAGGGGKGMRTVSSADDFLEQLAGAQREALAAFGDETVFLERLIQEPRHVEIQILGDMHGHLIYLGERECSIQRRHQKILEESPSVALTPTLREEMGTAAVRIARAAGYVNAGTIEFLLDADKHFYFLEMNTRLQVEHPVTELVTGLDLVRQQLRIAAGEPLDILQEDVVQRGHAIEVRLYAENPEQHFLPSTGRISRFIKPEGPGIRMDSGIAEGDEITQYYDPMIAKLIVYGEDRAAAIDRLQRALQRCIVFGVTTNIPLLHAVSAHPHFQQGDTYTDFLEKYGLLNASNPLELPDEALIAAALYEAQPRQDRESDNPWQQLGPWRMVGSNRVFTYRYHEQNYTVSIRPSTHTARAWHVQINTETSENIACTIKDDVLVLLRKGAHSTRLYIQPSKAEMQVALNGQLYRLQRPQPPDVATTKRGGGLAPTQKTLTAPMAGTIVKVHVHDGEAVEAHQVLVILSAMKMEHAIIAPYDGRVRRVHYQEGEVVPGGAIIVEMEEQQH
jgi:3-methylcrotonyl-CoA carboxylase alpha subunit